MQIKFKEQIKLSTIYLLQFVMLIKIIVIFSNVFLFQNHRMKNPYLNTDDYMITKQYNRLSAKKRSYSNSSQSSQWSTNSIKFAVEHSCTYKNNIRNNRYQNQYLISQSNNPVYNIQRKRAQVFGVQELRYKPAYFQNLNIRKSKQGHKQSYYSNNYQNKYKQKLKEKQKQKAVQLKTLKSIKQLRFCNSGPVSARQQMTKSVKKFSQSGDNFYDLKAADRFNAKRKSSILEEMIQLNFNNNSKSNQFYQSTADLKSRADLKSKLDLKSNNLLPLPKRLSKNKRKSSLFFGQHEKQKQIQQLKNYRQSLAEDSLTSKQTQSYVNNTQSQFQAHTQLDQQYQQRDPINEQTQNQYQIKAVTNNFKESGSSFKTSSTKLKSTKDLTQKFISKKVIKNPDAIKIRGKIFYRYEYQK